MDIVRYKKTGKNKYKITLSNNVELTIYEDVILKYELLLKKKINDKDLTKIKELNSYYEAYYFAVNSLNSKFKSISDMKRILKDKEYSDTIIDDVISKLIEQGYEVNMLKITHLSHTRFVANKNTVTVDFFNHLQKQLPELNKVQFIYCIHFNNMLGATLSY